MYLNLKYQSFFRGNSCFSFVFFVFISLFPSCAHDELIQIEEQIEEQIEDQNKDKNKDQTEPKLISKDFVIAHRGSWNGKDSPQNSMNAFEKALALNIYGVEFDVRQTKDGKLVIYHDELFNKISIGKSTYDEISLNKLSNGETIPLLRDFLSLRKQTKTDAKLIIDIKQCNIDDLVQLINEFDLQNEVVYITFTKTYCEQLANLGYGSNTFYSSNNITPTEIKELGFGGVCYKYTHLDINPSLIESAKSLDIKIMVWTVNNAKSIYDYSTKGVYVITDKPYEF